MPPKLDFTHLHGEIFEMARQGSNPCHIARDLIRRHHLTVLENSLREYIRRHLIMRRDQQVVPPTEAELQARILAQFRGQDHLTLADLSDALDIGVSRVERLVEGLRAQGHTLTVEDGRVLFSKIIQKSAPTVLSVPKMSSGWYRFGVTGDNHLGSRYARLDALSALYDLFKEEGITTVYNTGNWIDGEAHFNKHDLVVHGLEGQVAYWIDHYPQREGITTHYITGDDHEGWYTQREGINVGQYAQMRAEAAGRHDLRFLGHMEADVVLEAPNGRTVIRVLHPGGGSAYAISYTSQKIVESYTEGELPHILLDGHYHKAGYNYLRGIHVIQTGCTQDQTPFMRKKRLAAHVGGWIIEFSVDEQGMITRLKKEFIPFYDKGYYQKWNYQWQ